MVWFARFSRPSGQQHGACTYLASHGARCCYATDVRYELFGDKRGSGVIWSVVALVVRPQDGMVIGGKQNHFTMVFGFAGYGEFRLAVDGYWGFNLKTKSGAFYWWLHSIHFIGGSDSIRR